MINTPRNASAPSRYHKALARRRFWHVQLWRCSAFALAASLVAWLLALPLAWHLAAILAGFAAGFLWVERQARPWALDWIERESGLSYRTALELETAPDAYGFGAAVRERARQQIQRLQPPVLQPWWLPLLTLAFGLMLLPVLEQGRTPQAEAPRSAQAQTERPPDAAPSQGKTVVGTAPDDAPQAGTRDAGTLTSRRNPEVGQVEAATGKAGSSPAGDRETAPTDSETLSRFLQNLQQRPATPETPDPRPDEHPSGTGDQGRQGQQAAGEPQGRTHQQGGGQQTQGGRSKAGKTSSEPSQSTRQNGGQNDEQQPGAAPKQNAGGQQSAPGEAGQAEGKQQDEAAGNPTQAQGDPQSAKEKLQGGAGQGAGTKASTPLPGQTPRGVAQGQLESLQGRFRGGPSTIGGQVLIPGLADKPLPEGQAATGFRHALEKAVTEGRIPVEYQQILRDYYK